MPVLHGSEFHCKVCGGVQLLGGSALCWERVQAVGSQPGDASP